MTLIGHNYYMRKAIEQAEIAYNNKEVPVGAIIVYNNKIYTIYWTRKSLGRSTT